jgi:very-short-patch-repair endonuclease
MDDDAYRRAARAAARQGGNLTLAQALDAGLTRTDVRRLVRDAVWSSPRPGVFTVAGVPPTWEQQVGAACLAVGGVVGASHLTGARLAELRAPAPDRIDLLTTPDRRLSGRGIRHHRTSTLPPADLTAIRRVPVTTVARTLCDLGGLLSERSLDRAVVDAVRRELVTLSDLHACHERLALGPGRRPHRTMAAVLERRTLDLHPGDSDWELWVADTLTAAGFEPVQQHRVRIGRREFILDVALPVEMVDIEFDGWAAHRNVEAFHADRERMRLLAAAGWRLVPVTARTTAAALVDAVAAHVAAARRSA